MNITSINNRLVNGKWLMGKEELWTLYNNVTQLSELRYGGLYGKVFGNPMMAAAPQTTIVPSQEAEEIGDIAIIGIAGTLVKGATEDESNTLGWLNIDNISEAIDAVAEDDSVKDVIFNFASDGGEVTGIPELGRKIKALGDIKRTHAWTEFSAQSAAYWMYSQVNGLRGMTPTAEVGSIGVYVLRMDLSKKLAQELIEPHFISSGDYKASIGNEALPFTSEEEAMILEGCVETHNEFKEAILSSFPETSAEALQSSLSYSGAKALKHNLTDVVVDNFQLFLERIAKQ